MKILAISHAYTEPFTRAGLLDPELYPDVDLTVVIPAYQAAKAPEGYKLLQAQGYKVIRINSAFNFHQSIRLYCWKLAEIILRLRPDVIFLNNEPWSITAFQVVLICRLFRLKSRIMVYTFENQRRTFPLPFMLMQRFVLNNSHLLLSSTMEEGIEILRYKGYKGPAAYLPLSVNTTIFKPDRSEKILRLREKYAGTAEKAFVLGYTGRLVREKGIHHILEALENLPEDIKLLLIGDGDYRPDLEVLSSSLNLDNRVFFAGNIPNNELPECLNVVDALILPSLTTGNWKEQFGRVLVEAMACEKPVIGSSSGEIPYVLGSAGLIFPEGDVRELADRIMTLYKDEKLGKDLGVKGRKRVMELFDNRVVMSNTRVLYRKCIEGTIPYHSPAS